MKSCEHLKSLNEDIRLCSMDKENEDEHMVIGVYLTAVCRLWSDSNPVFVQLLVL